MTVVTLCSIISTPFSLHSCLGLPCACPGTSACFPCPAQTLLHHPPPQKALPCTCRALHGHTAHFASLSARKFIKQVVTYPPQSHFGSQSLQGLYCGHPWNFSGNILMEYSSQARQCGIPHFLFCCSALLWGQSRGGHQESWSSSAVRKG